MQDDLERVLKAAGPREKPPVEIERALRESLRQEWRAVVDERAAGRRRLGFALAAGLLAAAIGAWLAWPALGPPAETIGTIAVATGDLKVKSGRLGGWEAASGGRFVTTGEVLRTGPAGRAALALAGGISVRLDHATRLRVAASDRLVIDRGAVYVDAGVDAAGGAQLEIVTPAGSVRHLGTQYEVRLLEAGVRLRVREGRVTWRSPSGKANGVAGEQLMIGSGGRIMRGQVTASDADWRWAEATAPGIDIEGLPLVEFLGWAARELGCDVEYATSEVAAEARNVTLHGSVAGLAPAQALSTVLATTRMSATVAAGRVLVTARQ